MPRVSRYGLKAVAAQSPLAAWCRPSAASWPASFLTAALAYFLMFRISMVPSPSSVTYA